MRFDVIIIGGGLSAMAAGVELLRSGKRVAAVAQGLSLFRTDRAEFKRLGGTILAGDAVVEYEMRGYDIECLYTRNLGGTPLCAPLYVLATGKFFSCGLTADMDGIRESVFGLDVECDADRTRWCDDDFLATQRFERYGVITDEYARPFKGGKVVGNLYAAGEILAGISGAGPGAEERIRESALTAARSILNRGVI